MNRNKDLVVNDGDVTTYEQRQTFCSNLNTREIGTL